MENIFEKLGFNIIKKQEFEKMNLNVNNELNTLFNEEKFEMDNIRDFIDYELPEINEIVKDDNNKVIDILYKNTDKNTSYLEWYLTKDYVAGMEWYMKNKPHIPFIENLSYFFVKQDLTGKVKLDKYEKVIIKKQLRREKQHYKEIELKRDKCIKELIKKNKEPLKTIKYKRGQIFVKF